MKKFVALVLSMMLLFSVLPVLAEDTVPSMAVVVAGTLGDRGFYDSSNEGRQKLNDDFGARTTVVECREDGSLYESSLINAADEYDVVVAVGWQFGEYLPQVVADFPEVNFVFVDNALEGVGDNLMSIIYKQNEGSFLVGYIAAKLSKTGKIGVVGGENADTINDFIVGYEAGAQYADAAVTISRKYTEDYEDPAKGKEAALALYGEGCDIVFAVAGKTGEGVFEAAAETGNYAIGVDSDQKYINPEVILCSMVKRVGQSIYDVAAHMDERFLQGGIWRADMATGYIDVAYGTAEMPQQVSDELKLEVEVLKSKIISGEITVPTTLE